MANDAASKPTPIPNEHATLSNSTDQQKVPPLRIVLNSAGNQKSSTASATATNASSLQQTNTKKEKTQDGKTEGTVKVGGRVRIKLGTSKQQSTTKSSTNKNNESVTKRVNGGTVVCDRLIENVNDDSASSFSHLRRITRRSQRAVQSFSNEDEESISSMTSTDENQNTNNQTNSDIVTAQDSEQSNSATLTSGSTAVASSSATNGSSNAEAPRRHKRRKVETSESQSIDCDNLLGSQNYKLPNQNSFQLFKNIRNQVDKRLKNLNSVSPKIPFGFRDYMLTNGAYLLDGNKLGNGTSLFTNEDGGLSSAPLGKYRAIRHNRQNYSVPNRAKVPLGLPVNSPLYDLFVEQEKDRYSMRIQHIKEREKLTLAAEQEIMRVYNQAALAAVNQTEPFSACTMLKHQEIYNYMDSDGVTILSKEDAQQDQVQSDGVRTRNRHHEQISPPESTRKNSDIEGVTQQETSSKETENSNSPNQDPKSDNTTRKPKNIDNGETSNENETIPKDNISNKADRDSTSQVVDNNTNQEESPPRVCSSGICPISPPDDSGRSEIKEVCDSKGDVAPKIEDDAQSIQPDRKTETEFTAHESGAVIEFELNDAVVQVAKTDIQGASETPKELPIDHADEPDDDQKQLVTDKGKTIVRDVPEHMESTHISEEEKMAKISEMFLTKLQEVDDKWEKIRHDMLVRHKNEAESLHAIQKLEWEWKTKEIGACDVRTTLIIDNTLVPRLNIYSQDY